MALKLHSTPVRQPSFWLKLANALLGFRQAPFDRPDVVVASGDAYIGLLGYLMAKRYKAKFVFDVYDKYDEFAAFWRPFGWNSFAFLLRKAELCFFASLSLKKTLEPQCQRSSLVVNGVDTERFKPIDMQISRTRLGLPQSAIYIGYFGSMEPDRGIDDLIEAIQLLRNRGSDVQLLIGGKIRANLELTRPGIHYLGNLAFEDVPYALASCNVVAIPYRRSPFMDAGASNKIAEAIYAGKPIATTESPNFLSNFPQQAACLHHVVARCGDPDSLSRSINAQLISPIKVTPPSGYSWEDVSAAAFISIEALDTLLHHSGS